MANQFLKLRRSAVPGKIPDTGSLAFGEIALNTYDGLAFLKKSGSNGEEIVTIGANTINVTGSQFYIPVFTGTSSFASSSIYNSGSVIIITGSTSISGSLIVNNSSVILTNQTSSMSVATASYVAASNVAGLSLFQIATGSITASVGLGNDLFLIKSGSKTYFNISSSGDTTIYSSNFMIRDFNTNEMVFQVSASRAYFDFDGITIATQSIAPTGSADIGGILFTSTAMYIGLN